MDAPDPVCFRCSKPITPGTASQRSGRPVHMRCLAEDTRLDSVEQQDQLRRAQAAMVRAEDLIDPVRVYQTTCPACGQRLASPRGVLFQGDQLVHAACWRAEPNQGDETPAGD